MVAVTITNQNLDLKRMVRSELAEEMNCLEGAHDIGFLKIVKGIFRRARYSRRIQQKNFIDLVGIITTWILDA
jgi:phosphate starvation-inducible protein PhoH